MATALAINMGQRLSAALVELSGWYIFIELIDWIALLEFCWLVWSP
jgi:hypothetical protein